MVGDRRLKMATSSMPLSDYENTPFCQSLETLIFANNTENLFDLLITMVRKEIGAADLKTH